MVISACQVNDGIAEKKKKKKKKDEVSLEGIHFQLVSTMSACVIGMIVLPQGEKTDKKEKKEKKEKTKEKKDNSEDQAEEAAPEGVRRSPRLIAAAAPTEVGRGRASTAARRQRCRMQGHCGHRSIL